MRTKSENVNITRLISEAMKLDNEKSQKRTTDKKNEYRKLIMNVKLNDNDKNVHNYYREGATIIIL